MEYSKKKESSPDGSIDQNVFDIMQGVSINLFVKTGKKKADLVNAADIKYKDKVLDIYTYAFSPNEDKLILLEFHFFVFYYNVSLKFLEIVLIDLIKKMGYTSIQLENLKILKG